MSDLPERTVDAILVLRYGYAGDWPGRRDSIQRDYVAASDPALGPDRLVVAGPFEREIIEKVCAWLSTTEDREGNDAALAHGALDSDHIADMIRNHFGRSAVAT